MDLLYRDDPDSHDALQAAKLGRPIKRMNSPGADDITKGPHVTIDLRVVLPRRYPINQRYPKGRPEVFLESDEGKSDGYCIMTNR